LLDVVDALGHLHAAALATATGVDLGLDHPHGAAELLGCFHGFLHRESGNAARNGHTKIAQDFLALVFVNLHEVSLREGWYLPVCHEQMSGRGLGTWQPATVSWCVAPISARP